MKVAYDIDDSLCEHLPAPKKKWRRMNKQEKAEWRQSKLYFYQHAKVLFKPVEKKFWAITGRGANPDVVRITMLWLTRRFGNRIQGVYFPEKTQSFAGVGIYKAKTLQKFKFDRYYENSRRVIKTINRLYPHCETILVKDGKVVK